MWYALIAERQNVVVRKYLQIRNDKLNWLGKLKMNCMLKKVLIGCFVMTINALTAQTSPSIIKKQLDTIVNRDGFRTYLDTATLNSVRDYLFDEFSKHSSSPYLQNYRVKERTYSNVVTIIGDSTKPRVVVGAHYDVCGDQQGADDNGTGVVGLLQALEQLKNFSSEDYCLEFVAYTLEEPPFYGTGQMGSYIHARSLSDRGVEVFGMISLEMIGYFSTEKKSQRYPIGILKLFYGGKADYITVVRKMNKGKFARKFSRKYKHSNTIRTKKLTAPKSLQGIDFSDHRNYWFMGYDAIMLTDTAFYRNDNYHQVSDTIDTIDFERMAKVIDGLVKTLREI